MKKEKILVTSALPYANGTIHLGHLSGAYLPADIFVRFKRLAGADIIYICGSDEHGVAITITADKEKITPQEVIDKFHNINKEAFEKFGMSFDIYSRTSIPEHHKLAQKFFKDFYDRDILVEKKSLQFYDEQAKMFLPDRYVEGTCPKCGNDQARSDECEACGALYDPTELKNPKSKVSGQTPVLKETSHWYFPLQNYQKRLEEYVYTTAKKNNWKENVINYCNGWFKAGLQERAITRDLDWGVKLPIENAEGKVLYVWFDAVLGYISGTQKLGEKLGRDLVKEYWQDPETKYYAFIGKDNVVFHCIIFPAMLMAWNDGNPKEQYILPANVPANEFLNFEGKKFSKSRGWGIDVIDFLKLFPADLLRYTLAANLPETRDTDFFWKEFQMRTNGELADIFGNFVNRTLTFVNRNFNNEVPAITKLEDIDKEMIELLENAPQKIASYFDIFKIKDGVNEIMNIARACNKYFNDSEPWKSIKNDQEKCATTLNICVQAIFTLAELFSPVIPFTSEKIFSMLNAKPVEWENAGKMNLQIGHKLGKAEILFTKIEDKVIEEQINKLGVVEENKEEEQITPIKDEITIDDFAKIDLRVVEVLEAEKIEKSNKLLKLKVKLGNTVRQVVSGIAQHYEPKDLIGKKVILVANLKPAKLMGNDSYGMILAVDDDKGNLKVVEIDNSMPTGSLVK
ncbi:MAG TPA: methionine--tRNA ligase [Ignavibacteriales bacterium]|nr:methionine--tRNA ligase [Ignavibacteriales bacterium]HOL80500.1 methionine--tRNA ligase [Ignavibacteriales bacterium]HPP33164.1 methionine--tRNA ligase [Ignavibacteriales bacterium]HRR19428.1 methionine--tRNA ligase [Ignavibacteriales bacterium]